MKSENSTLQATVRLTKDRNWIKKLKMKMLILKRSIKYGSSVPMKVNKGFAINFNRQKVIHKTVNSGRSYI